MMVLFLVIGFGRIKEILSLVNENRVEAFGKYLEKYTILLFLHLVHS